MKVLVLGGSGNFGSRFCRALATDPAIELRTWGMTAEGREEPVHETLAAARDAALLA